MISGGCALGMDGWLGGKMTAKFFQSFNLSFMLEWGFLPVFLIFLNSFVCLVLLLLFTVFLLRSLKSLKKEQEKTHIQTSASYVFTLE